MRRLWQWLKGTDVPVLDGWQRPRPCGRGILLDIAIGVALGLSSMVSWSIQRFLSPVQDHLGTVDSPVDPWFAGLCALAYAAILSIRRVFPLCCLFLFTVVYIVVHTMQYYEGQVEPIALLVCLYSAGAWSNRRATSTLLRLGLLGFVLLVIFFLIYNGDQEFLAGIQQAGMHVDEVQRALMFFNIMMNVIPFGCVFLFGNSSYRRAALAAFLKEQRIGYREQAAQLRAERKLVAEQAVRLDRVAIARDLHDIVAHHVSLMGLQAAGARRIMARDPQEAQRALLAIEESSRTAVSELQGMLTALRDPEVEPGTASNHAQAPSTRSIEQLGELAAEYRRAGGRIGFQVIGEPGPVPPVIAITAYRIMQESLTNIRKHAGLDTDADARLRYLPGAIELEISDCGPSRGQARDHAGTGVFPSEAAASGRQAHAVPAHAGSASEAASAGSAAHAGAVLSGAVHGGTAHTGAVLPDAARTAAVLSGVAHAGAGLPDAAHASAMRAGAAHPGAARSGTALPDAAFPGAVLSGTAFPGTAHTRSARAASPHARPWHAGPVPEGSGHAGLARGGPARGTHAVPGPVGGRGLMGMRERVRAVRGALEAGPRSGGGFRVRARLPLTSAAAGAEGAWRG